MSYKDILALVDSAGVRATLQAASAIAMQFDAHLVALHAEPYPFVPLEVGVVYPPTLIELQEKAAQEATELAARAIEAATREFGCTIERRIERGDADAAALLHGRHADLIVMGLGEPTAKGTNTVSLPWESIVIAAGRPVIAIPSAYSGTPIGHRILVAWRPTRESTRALHDALPFLVRAESVRVATFGSAGNRPARDPGSDVALHLARHGVTVEATSREVQQGTVGAALLAEARAFGADLIVAGAYGHARLREYVLGGTTLHLARHTQVPLLSSH